MCILHPISEVHDVGLIAPCPPHAVKGRGVFRGLLFPSPDV